MVPQPKAPNSETDTSLIVAMGLVLLPFLWLVVRACAGDSQRVVDDCLQRQINRYTVLHQQSPNSGEVSQMVQACQRQQAPAANDGIDGDRDRRPPGL